MAFDTEIANALAGSMINRVTALLDVGAGAIINIYTGTQPANCETAVTGTLLATLLCSATCFPGYTDLNPGARITANAITSDTNADATGTAGYFRAYSTTTTQNDANKTTCYVQGTVGTSGTDMILDSVSIVTAGTVAVTSWTMTLPES